MSDNKLSDAIDLNIKKLHVLSSQSVRQSEPYSKFVVIQAMLWVTNSKIDALLEVLDKKYGFDQGQTQLTFVRKLEEAVYAAEKALGVQVTDGLTVNPGIKIS